MADGVPFFVAVPGRRRVGVRAGRLHAAGDAVGHVVAAPGGRRRGRSRFAHLHRAPRPTQGLPPGTDDVTAKAASFWWWSAASFS